MPAVIVIFGASGDLTARKLIPALYGSFRKRRLPEGTRIIGFAREPMTDAVFRERLRNGIRSYTPELFDEQEWNAFAPLVGYQIGNFTNRDDFNGLAGRLRTLNPVPSNFLHYFATAPAFYPDLLNGLRDAGLLAESPETGYRRIVIEKPFGRDLPSALELNALLHRTVAERQVFRIDHYLGKETVQNVLVLRFGNAIFEPLWNRNYIDHVQITVAESVGVEHRGGYYDGTGVLRDMFQNHLLQLLTLVALEPPAIFEAEALRNEKVKVLKAIREIPEESVAEYTVRGQYDGYRREPRVAPDSNTETFAALRLFVDNWRWQGVPFFLRSGKMLGRKLSEIVIQFRRPPTQMFDVQSGVTELFTNRLAISIQPDEGMRLRFITKVPDRGMETRPVDMDFMFTESFGSGSIPDSYERLLLDALNGDATLFARSDEIELAWKFVDGIRRGWDSVPDVPLHLYPPGSWGPVASDQLLGRGGRWWIEGADVSAK